MVAVSGREYAILLAMVAFIVGLSVWRRNRRAEAARQRALVLQKMGFVESTRDQVFGDKIRQIERAIDGTGLSRLPHSIGKGHSVLGETLIFDLKNLSGTGTQSTSYTVIGVRAGGPVAYFEITSQDRLKRIVQNAIGAGAGVTPSGEPLFNVPLASAEKPDLAEHYRVLASDPGQMGKVLTSAFVDALGHTDGRKLTISKWGTEWLFFYRTAMGPLSPQAYPALLSEAIGLLSLLDLRGAGLSN